MEIKVNRDELVNALQITNLAINSNRALSILNNILFEVNERNLTITATDLEVFIRHNATIDSDVKARFTVPAKKLKDIISSLPDTDITFGFKDGKKMLDITADKAKFSINTFPADDFPKIEIAGKEKTIMTQQAVLKEILAKTIFAVSKDDTRHVITGVSFEIKDKRLTMAGTDGRRLAVASCDIDAEIDELRCILPAKALKNLLQILQKEGEARIYIDKSLVSFEADNTTIGIRLIEGEYPDYQKVIPNETKIEFNLDVQKLIDATKRASIITKDGSGVRYSFKNKRLTITASTPEIGDAKEELEIEGLEEIEIVFYPHYILEALQNINAEKVILGLNTNTSPAMIEPLEDGNYIQVIMPMQA